MLQYTCFNTRVAPLGGFVSSLPVGSCSDDLLCTEDEIADFITSFKACGLDNISLHMLKCTLPSVVSPLTHISIQTVGFLIVSMIVPIPKSASCRGSLSSYRPISLLPVVSKLLERHIYGLLSDHLAIAQPLSDHQWGFCLNRYILTILGERYFF